MAASLKASFRTTVAHLTSWRVTPEKEEAPKVVEEVHMLGDYKVDYSEPTQAELDAIGPDCADLFAMGEWISVNRKS
jgi:hypothetical protein